MTAVAQPKNETKPALTVTIHDSHVIASGVTPHSRVVFFGIARFIDRYRVTVRRFDKTLIDDDGDGVVDLDIKEKVPWKSVFAVIDFTRGAFALATPPDFPLQPMAVESEMAAVRSAASGQVDNIVLSHRYCDMVLVRPGVGVWGQILGDGNKFDDDGLRDGKVRCSPGRSIALGGDGSAAERASAPAPPKSFARGDVLVFIDTMRMQACAVEVGSK